MSYTSSAVPMLHTPQDVERAIRNYRASDVKGWELICQWQAIRDASLNQDSPEPENDRVIGEESY